MKPFWDLPAPEVVGRDSLIDDIALDHMIDRLRRMRAWTADLERVNEGPHPASLGRFVSFASRHGSHCEIRMEPKEARLLLSGTVGGVDAQILLVFPSFEVALDSIGPDAPRAIMDVWEASLLRVRRRLLTNLTSIVDPDELREHAPFRDVLVATAAIIAAHMPELERDVAIRLHAPISGFVPSLTNHSGRQLLRTPVERRVLTGVPTAATIRSPMPDQMMMGGVEFSASRLAIGPVGSVETLRMLADSGFANEPDPLMPSTRRSL